ncbi:MAG: L-histidine N(alpha)-methyltransferase [Leptolyngbyaceae cyanobacterium bins.302]|nr:L-histidine N(alpha)-methyltransferase [Leptolyngbyaceae cyanobacterium bins.302]
MSFFESTDRTTSYQVAPSWADRFLLENLVLNDQETNPAILGRDVVEGLTQTPKTLPAKYFYDDRGSELFEQICGLPEYYLTRTEAAILQQYSKEIVELTGACELVELGSGSSTKTRSLLSAYQQAGYPLSYRPIDVSAGILEDSAKGLLKDYSNLKVHALVSTYELGLQHLSAGYFPKRMISFLGSSLGNLSPDACDGFFDQIVKALRSGDFFLLGVDLHKPTAQLEAAYNDNQGITAAFNLNILHHLNRRFSGNFDLNQFEHWSFYNEAQHQIEMHLRSLKQQTVYLAALDLRIDLQPNETIRSEISRKFDSPSLQQQLADKGLYALQTWTDPQQWFAVMLFQYQIEEDKSCG